MKLNHLNLTVTNPMDAHAFLVKYFGLKPMGKANNNMAFLTDDNGMVLSLMNVKLDKESEVHGSGISRGSPWCAGSALASDSSAGMHDDPESR